jgi:hypothetical protein
MILGILILDTILRTPALIRGLFRSRAQQTDDMAVHERIEDR